MKVEKMFIRPTKAALFLPISFLLHSNFSPVTRLSTPYIWAAYGKKPIIFCLKITELKIKLALGKDYVSSYTL